MANNHHFCSKRAITWNNTRNTRVYPNRIIGGFHISVKYFWRKGIKECSATLCQSIIFFIQANLGSRKDCLHYHLSEIFSSGKISGLFAWKSSPLNRLKSPSSISSLTTSENLASSHSRTPIGIILLQLIFDITHFFNLELKICGNWNKVAWIIWKGKMYSYCPFWAFLF